MLLNVSDSNELRTPRSKQRSRDLASLACQALIAEAELTPKSGLVDRRGTGAHTDLSLDLMRRSARVLEPYFATMSLVSQGRFLDRSLREHLALIGREAERAMFKSTQGDLRRLLEPVRALSDLGAERDSRSASRILLTNVLPTLSSRSRATDPKKPRLK